MLCVMLLLRKNRSVWGLYQQELMLLSAMCLAGRRPTGGQIEPDPDDGIIYDQSFSSDATSTDLTASDAASHAPLKQRRSISKVDAISTITEHVSCSPSSQYFCLILRGRTQATKVETLTRGYSDPRTSHSDASAYSSQPPVSFIRHSFYAGVTHVCQ